MLYNKHKDSDIPPDAVYIGRPSKWGNPFELGKDGSRDVVCDKHIVHVMETPGMVEAIREELKGKDLVCFCKPLRCHGEFLGFVANSEGDLRIPQTSLNKELF